MNKKGFTLVELLVVIAIIGILSSVAVINLNSARNKAKAAAAQATIAQLTTPVILCLDAQSSVAPLTASNNGLEGGNLCTSASAVNVNWPKVNQQGYNYNNNALKINSNNDTLTWNIWVENTVSGLTNIQCTEQGCVIQAS